MEACRVQRGSERDTESGAFDDCQSAPVHQFDLGLWRRHVLDHGPENPCLA